MALAPKYILLTSGTSWTVPADWNSGANSIHIIGGGGGKGTTYGGGGGGYARVTNFSATPGSTIGYSIGAGGASGVDGSATYWDSTVVQFWVTGGYNGNTNTGGGGTWGKATNLNNGTWTGAFGGYGSAQGFGGGAGGPNGNGTNGTGVDGGSGDAGFGGGGAGKNGQEIWPGVAGSGGGASSLAAGLYGGGGGGSFTSGAQGAIIIEYISSSSGYTKDDSTYGTLDLDDVYVTDAWLVDQFVGSNLFFLNGNGIQSGLLSTAGVALSAPVQIGNSSWLTAGGGRHFGAAIRNDGSLWSWGLNSQGATAFGCLGDGTTVNKSTPIQIGTLTNWKLTTGGYYFQIALKTDGTIWSWGNNSQGQLGSGTTVSRSSPVQVGTLNNWKQISASNYQVTAINTNGTLWTWGSGVSSAVQVGTLTNWKYVNAYGSGGAGAGFFAIKTDGSLWAQGSNTYGTMGNGSTVTPTSPIQIGTLTNWAKVWVGRNGEAAAIKTDGTLWTWGRNNFGQLGQGDTVDRSSPTQVGSLTNWKYITINAYYEMSAVKTDGTLWEWGNATYNTWGLSSLDHRSSPTQIGSLTNWKLVSIGHYAKFGINFADIT